MPSSVIRAKYLERLAEPMSHQADRSDVERSGMSGTGTQRAADTNASGDPGRTPGKAEGVENPEEEGNE